MKTIDLRAEFTKETKIRFNTEWIAYNDYVYWLEQRLVKLLTIPPVINCPNCASNNIAKYKSKIAVLQQKQKVFESKGMAGACVSLQGEIQAYNAVITDIEREFNTK